MSSLLYALGRWAVKARVLVVLIWVGALVLLGTGGVLLNRGLDNSVTIPGTESGDALERLYATFPEVSGSPAQIIVVGPRGSDITADPVKSTINEVIDRFYQVDGVEIVTPIADPLMAAEVSADGSSALITVQVLDDTGIVDDETKSALQGIADELNASLPAGYFSSLGGVLFAQEFPTISITEVLGVIVALIVLLITLGTLIGAGLPLMVALAGVAVSTALVFIGTSFATINATTPLLSVMLGLAVGIDYALFIVSRHRDNLKTGLSVTESIGRSLGTSGSAVVFAGATVMIALLGLGVAGIPFLTVMGVVGAMGVGLAVVASCTLLPAVLSFAGMRILTKKERRALLARQEEAGEEATIAVAATDGAPIAEAQPDADLVEKPNWFFNGWIKLVTAVPALTIIVVVVGLGALSLPALNLRLALPDAGVLPEDNEARETFELIDEHFGEGFNGPLIVTAPILTSTDPLGLMDSLAAEVEAVPGVVSVVMATPNMTADTGIIQVIPEHDGRSAETAQLVHDLRGLHDQLEAEYGVNIAVTGMTAVGVDVSEKLAEALLPFAIVVVGLSLILLTIVFRSIAVPVVAVIGYLLSVASAFGVVVLVFENGLFADLLGVAALGPIINFMPLVTMGILFGLSMDYQVFLVSRMLEDYTRTGRARRSVYTGFLGSAKVVTAAAVIMVAVFAAFVPEGDMNLKPIALGLAVGVAIDAFIVRMGLVPAVMVLLGKKAWWIPNWLDRVLPRFDIEGEGVLRERSLKSWPGAPTSAAVYGLVLEGLQAPLKFQLPEGENLLIRGADSHALIELVEVLGARRKNDTGTVKVLGRLLPQRGASVRSKVACLRVATDAELRSQVEEAVQEKAQMLVVYAGPAVRELLPLKTASASIPVIVATEVRLEVLGDDWRTLDLDEMGEEEQKEPVADAMVAEGANS